MQGVDANNGRVLCADTLRQMTELPGKMKWVKEARAQRLPKLPGSQPPEPESGLTTPQHAPHFLRVRGDYPKLEQRLPFTKAHLRGLDTSLLWLMN